jgi:DNA replicative helicase MCM subunit Mcm2 (Cdc46/Mcm family)
MKYFHLRRRENHPSMERVSVRLLESLLRLSQAHAKLMYQKEVLLHDAIIAINCVSCSQTQSISGFKSFTNL